MRHATVVGEAWLHGTGATRQPKMLLCYILCCSNFTRDCAYQRDWREGQLGKWGQLLVNRLNFLFPPTPNSALTLSCEHTHDLNGGVYFHFITITKKLLRERNNFHFRVGTPARVPSKGIHTCIFDRDDNLNTRKHAQRHGVKWRRSCWLFSAFPLHLLSPLLRSEAASCLLSSVIRFSYAKY